MTFSQIRKKLRKKTVGIAGAGGLGSNCAIALARVGIGKLVIADFDVIRVKNLNRQYYYREQVGQKKAFATADNIFFINPYVKVKAYDIKLGPEKIVEIYRDCDLIIEAFDLAEMKEMIIDTVLTEFPDKPLIAGTGLAGWGNTNSLKVKQSGNLYICGDEKTEISNEDPPLAPRVGIVANMQANVALEILLNSHKK